jgi:hypothetical protein
MQMDQFDRLIWTFFPGFVYFGNSTESPCFVQALCSELQEKGNSDDILTILRSVNQRMALDLGTGPSEGPSMDEMKQMLSFEHTFTRRLIFTRK